MTVGYLPGVFDLLHIGHHNIVESALSACDSLVLGIHTDEFVTEYKRRPFQSQTVRLDNVRRVYGARIVHYVIVGHSHKDVITSFGVTHVFHGSDWELESYKRQIRYDQDKLNVEIVIVPYTDGIATTVILDKIGRYRNIKTFLFDLDQTLVLNGVPTTGALECVQYIQRHPTLQVRVVTNNTKYAPDEIASSLGLFNIHSEKVRSPLISIGEYLRERRVHSVYVWGTPSARAYLSEYATSSLEDADLIVVMYRDDFTYVDLCALLTKIRATTPYLISNIDWTYPDTNRVLPDVGMFMQMIQQTTGELPERVFGKPNADMCGVDVDRATCLMVGDREMTDGKLADALGCPFFHVHGAHDLAMLHTILHAIHG